MFAKMILIGASLVSITSVAGLLASGGMTVVTELSNNLAR